MDDKAAIRCRGFSLKISDWLSSHNSWGPANFRGAVLGSYLARHGPWLYAIILKKWHLRF
jgi:hypothetical protein